MRSPRGVLHLFFRALFLSIAIFMNLLLRENKLSFGGMSESLCYFALRARQIVMDRDTMTRWRVIVSLQVFDSAGLITIIESFRHLVRRNQICLLLLSEISLTLRLIRQSSFNRRKHFISRKALANH